MSKKSEQFGKILKNLLEVNNMKQCELSQKLNTTDTTISKYINGIQLPRFEMMNDIAELFNVSIDYLLGSEDNNVLLAPDESEIMTIPVLKHLRYTDSLHTPTEDNIDQYYQLPRRKYSVYNEVFAVKVHKDHMYPRIMEGDIVICETISIADNLIDLGLGNGCRLDGSFAFTQETQYIGNVAEKRVTLVREVTLNQHIARKKIALLNRALTILQCYYFLSRNKNLRDILLKERRGNQGAFDILFHLVLLTADCTEYIPFKIVFSHNNHD